ncbi:MAG: hypothetical protein K6F37_00160, partial [Lachnospiraceae bacterium]|nr:hypothetical protein [Lachnospiraceae bacterium]
MAGSFKSYDEYMRSVFDCVNRALDAHLEGMKQVFASGQGGFKNVLYPDLEVASDITRDKIISYDRYASDGVDEGGGTENTSDISDDDNLDDLLAEFASGDEGFDFGEKEDDFYTEISIHDRIVDIRERADAAVSEGILLPFHTLCTKRDFEDFTYFCFACAILSSTQTDYAGVFQIINENGGLSSPTIESAAKLYYGVDFSITKAYGDMSACLEQLLPILDLRVVPSMPFSTAVSPDKRIIDFLFGRHPLNLDENYSRFVRMLTRDNDELDEILCNANVLEAMEIAYNDGSRLFSYLGDEGSGRKFFVRQFCNRKNMRALAVNCKKLFAYDYGFVEKAIWSVTRECILTDGCCVLDELAYREEEKEKFFGYMDLFFLKLSEKGFTVFANSKESINFKEITKEQITLLELAPPDIDGRMACWDYYAKGYQFMDDVDFFEMSTKFLFTPGKIKDAVRYAKSLAAMEKSDKISRAILFKSCNAQMSSELSQKATRVEAKFGFEDIVMNPDQRETIMHAIE